MLTNFLSTLAGIEIAEDSYHHKGKKLTEHRALLRKHGWVPKDYTHAGSSHHNTYIKKGHRGKYHIKHYSPVAEEPEITHISYQHPGKGKGKTFSNFNEFEHHVLHAHGGG